MRILQIIGGKKSGKTSTMVDFIRFAKSRDLKVVALKRSRHEVEFDHENTDSYRFAAAGADAVGLSAGQEFMWRDHEEKSLEERINEQVPADTDLLLIEGFRTSDFEKLLLLKEGKSREDFAEFSNIKHVGTIFKDQLTTVLEDLTDENREKWFEQWLMN